MPFPGGKWAPFSGADGDLPFSCLYGRVQLPGPVAQSSPVSLKFSGKSVSSHGLLCGNGVI